MKALIFRETGEPKNVLKLEDIPTPPLAPSEALVRVLLSPITHPIFTWCAGAMAISRSCQQARALKAWGLWRP